MKSMKLFVIGAALLAGQAQAQNPSGVTLGIPSYAGTGCPQGSASVSLSPDASALSILFDNYVAEAGGATRKTIDRKACSISIPVGIPQGFSVSLLDIDYRGFNSLPHGASSQFNVEYFFAGRAGPVYRKLFVGPLESDYLLTNTLVATAHVWSPCGADVNLRTNTSVMLRTNGRREEALTTLDSQDVRASMIYHLKWRQCR